MQVKGTLEQQLGTEKFRKEYVIMRVKTWVAELKLLTKIAKFFAQAGYYAFTSGFRQKFNYVIRFILNINHLLEPIENVILYLKGEDAMSKSASFYLYQLNSVEWV